MPHFTHDDFSALFQDHDRFTEREFPFSPGEDAVNRILGYNRALSVRQTKVMPNVRLVLN
ncbi:MAG: hypothetical protein ACFCUH_02385 [Flavobacteriales bacterium]|jgi:hypothetical protein